MTKQLRELVLEEYIVEPEPDTAQQAADEERVEADLIERAIERLLSGAERRGSDW